MEEIIVITPIDRQEIFIISARTVLRINQVLLFGLHVTQASSIGQVTITRIQSIYFSTLVEKFFRPRGDTLTLGVMCQYNSLINIIRVTFNN